MVFIIFFRDLKPENILLDQKVNTKLFVSFLTRSELVCGVLLERDLPNTMRTRKYFQTSSNFT